MNWKLLNHMWKILQIFQCGSLGSKFSGTMKAKQVFLYMLARLVFITIYFKKCCSYKIKFCKSSMILKKNALRVHYSQSHVFVCYLDCPNILYYRNLVRILQWGHILYFQARVLTCFCLNLSLLGFFKNHSILSRILSETRF